MDRADELRELASQVGQIAYRVHGCVGNFLSCRKGVKDPLEVPGVRCD